MKGIIKVDVPKSCMECEFKEELNCIVNSKAHFVYNAYSTKRHPQCPIVPLDEVVEALETIEKRYTHMYMTMSQNVINGQVMVYDNPMRGFNTIRKALGVEE